MTTGNSNREPRALDGWHIAEDLEYFLARAGAFLYSRPVQHTLLLTLTENVRVSGPYAYGPETPVLGFLERAGEICATFFRAAPHRLNLTPLTGEETDLLADYLAGVGRRIPGVYGDHNTATAFSNAWHRRTGSCPTLRERQCLYRLDTLIPQQKVPRGHARLAAEGDREEVARLYRDFSISYGEPPSRAPQEWADAGIAAGGITLWETPDGTPAAIAGMNAMVAGQIRLSIAYTPEHLRGRGYAGAAIAAVTRAALDADPHDVLLFTNLANPTSNALVRRLGYRPVGNFALYDFASC